MLEKIVNFLPGKKVLIVNAVSLLTILIAQAGAITSEQGNIITQFLNDNWATVLAAVNVLSMFFKETAKEGGSIGKAVVAKELAESGGDVPDDV